ncbi:bifunctional 4-hydroxy-2-oxoglutarate aldolase/2-dehydro-3-deoxy-phosphogluconate aldolase [Pseudomonas sp. GD04087]|uniref:bifunctional 4-hydroxy-2-oxoglutarate aldolase/2-dehydro-3-deoxy-phosphogluconate aldolase n=1 Tax=unclassified Pseudomonas TaxID=196821 RepID=UPI00244A925F|nr:MULTISPECIES: bifunctional 4-hydroxy-2-oxoglutarate aldolase/2-dehydro-3-deoxy-phosphogluconate aldolase [unclassified Pseudomonas]MDH0291841.1 bifunctional 4-hydroxy-2-oxoglutarate aldolase/2-dehydro-3-deoxy-phosphogluconate aldolase [Pseudomonas sp. GD04087]MDH1051881.1 bifunctional 4-hydroxy-2-oxoglutarate aldolase/2-dehydro-3-deoxy-phosphogluconate aldolase [Pseudomonas sp. GD03903]MDH2001783.1 bifunctional 4-hydroxy-2-oxoglutarate aldolase/2-dehydro-3-deoxy-phosphogluconate aldolase [Pse
MNLSLDWVLQKARPVMPVLVIDDVALAADLAHTLYDGGVRVLEVTLRTPQALDAVAEIRRELPEMIVGAGTLIHTEQFQEARDAGAQFAVSPGCTPRLVAAADDAKLPFLPGVMTPSEVLVALEYGYRSLKLFPADGNAAIKMLKSLKAPFAGIRFCPTGGITQENLLNVLRLPNVACVGGTWIAPPSLVRARAWDQITQLAAEAIALAASLEHAS